MFICPASKLRNLDREILHKLMIQDITTEIAFIHEKQIVFVQSSHVRVSYITSALRIGQLKCTKQVPKDTGVINKGKRVK